MITIGDYLGITKATEVLIITLIGISCTIFDASILDLHTNLGKVWSISLDSAKFSVGSQSFLKYLLSGIILVRTFSVHLYLAFYIVMLWPAVFEERPNLLLPWLTVGAVKSLGMGFLSFTAGMYACFVYGEWRPACIDFFFAQIIDNAPSMYAWIIVLRDLKVSALNGLAKNFDKTNVVSDDLALRRRMTRSINADIVLDKQNVKKQFLNENFNKRIRSDTNTVESRSLDSLLIKYSNDSYVEGNVSNEALSPTEEDPKTTSLIERTIKALEITDSDIERARKHQKTRSCFSSSTNLFQSFAKTAVQLPEEKNREDEIPDEKDVVPEEKSVSESKSEDQNNEKYLLEVEEDATQSVEMIEESRMGNIDMSPNSTKVSGRGDESDRRCRSLEFSQTVCEFFGGHQVATNSVAISVQPSLDVGVQSPCTSYGNYYDQNHSRNNNFIQDEIEICSIPFDQSTWFPRSSSGREGIILIPTIFCHLDDRNSDIHQSPGVGDRTCEKYENESQVELNENVIDLLSNYEFDSHQVNHTTSEIPSAINVGTKNEKAPPKSVLTRSTQGDNKQYCKTICEKYVDDGYTQDYFKKIKKSL